jgi:hypothetical protein
MEQQISVPLVRNRSHRSENIWANTNNQPLVLQLSQTHTYSKNADTAYMYGYLILEKNLRTLINTYRKLYFNHYFRISKQKRNAFRRMNE